VSAAPTTRSAAALGGLLAKPNARPDAAGVRGLKPFPALLPPAGDRSLPSSTSLQQPEVGAGATCWGAGGGSRELPGLERLGTGAGCGPKNVQLLVVARQPPKRKVALASLRDNVGAGGSASHRARPAGGWPRTICVRWLNRALGALMAGPKGGTSPRWSPFARPPGHGLAPGTRRPRVGLCLPGPVAGPANHGPWLKPLCWPCGARAPAPGPFG